MIFPLLYSKQSVSHANLSYGASEFCQLLHVDKEHSYMTKLDHNLLKNITVYFAFNSPTTMSRFRQFKILALFILTYTHT